MTVFKLRDKTSGLFYKGSGYFDKKGNVYTSKGHIKNSLTQTWGGQYQKIVDHRKLDLEIVTYEMTEQKTEAL